MGQAGSNVKRSQSDIQTFLDKEKEKFIERIENPIRQNARLEDFDLIRTIGTGSFGKKKSPKKKKINLSNFLFHYRSSFISNTSR
jgi:hypothetical protein